MTKQKQTKSQGKLIVYRIAKWTWLITAWIWAAIIITFLAQYVPAVLTVNKGDLIQKTLTGMIIQGLRTPTKASSLFHIFSYALDIPKLLVLSIIVLLIVLPVVAFGFKQTLQNVEREGLDKLVDVLEKDTGTILEKLDELQKDLKQQIQKQNDSVEKWEQIHVVLQKTSSEASGIQGLYIQSQRQHEAMLKEFSQVLQGIQSRAMEQAGWLGDLYQLDKDRQGEIVSSLAKVTHLLEQVRDSLHHLSVPDQHKNGAVAEQQRITEQVPVAISLVSTDLLPEQIAE
jgi:uncharacterized protein YoxC